MEIPLASASMSVSAVMKVFMASLRFRTEIDHLDYGVINDRAARVSQFAV
jgi:hypothetical protein